MFRKHKHAPVKFTLRVKTLYGLCEKMGEGPDNMPMPTPRQRKETLVDAFTKDFRLAYDLLGGEYMEPFAEIGQIMEDHFDRERVSSSSSSNSDSTESSESSNGSAKSDSSNGGRKKKVAKSNKRKNKKSEYFKKMVRSPRRRPNKPNQQRNTLVPRKSALSMEDTFGETVV